MAMVNCCGKPEGGSCLVPPNSLRVSAEAMSLVHCDLPFVWNGGSEALGMSFCEQVRASLWSLLVPSCRAPRQRPTLSLAWVTFSLPLPGG